MTSTRAWRRWRVVREYRWRWGGDKLTRAAVDLRIKRRNSLTVTGISAFLSCGNTRKREAGERVHTHTHTLTNTREHSVCVYASVNQVIFHSACCRSPWKQTTRQSCLCLCLCVCYRVDFGVNHVCHVCVLLAVLTAARVEYLTGCHGRGRHAQVPARLFEASQFAFKIRLAIRLYLYINEYQC